MPLWFLSRILQAAFVIWAMTAIVFIGLNVIGNPADLLIPQDADAAERARVITQLGLDQPLLQQYFNFIVSALHGDLGNSFVFSEPALKLILERMPATLELAFVALIIAVVIGIPLGLYAGLFPENPVSQLIMGGSILGFSLPSFWVGLLLIMFFSVYLGWLPASGRGETREVFGIGWSFLTMDGLQHLLLPALNLALFKLALIIRLVRAGVQEVLPQEYIKFARAKGISQSRILFVHVLKNTLVPVVTVLGLEFGSMIAFSVVTESIFGWPGMGKLIIDSINVLDRPVVVAYLILIVVLFVTINLIVDLLYAFLDPRVRTQGVGR